MSLMSGIQVVLQYPTSSGGRRCRTFVGFRDVTPAWFCVWPIDGDILRGEQLGQEIAVALVDLSPNIREIQPPCDGQNLGTCHAASERECAKVLLPIVTSGSRPLQPLPAAWSLAGENRSVLPVVAPGSSPTSLPPSLRHLNTLIWSPGDRLAIGQILRAGELLSARPRIFISYVRRDAQRVADQIFGQLTNRGFEVFLDRLSLEPGSDFQVRLAEELSYMGTVLILESRRTRQSSWVRHEIDFARKHHLGLIAVQLPGGGPTPGVGFDRRLSISKADLTRTRITIRRATLNRLLAWTERAHAEAERVRMAYLRDNISDALVNNGFTRQGFDRNGIVVARKMQEYAFRVTNLPPELGDFHRAERYRSGRKVFVIAPAKYMDWRSRQPIDWLSSESDIALEDQGDVLSLVGRLS